MAWVKLGGSGGPIQKWNATGQEIRGVFMGLRNGKEFRAGQGPSKLADFRGSDGKTFTTGAPSQLEKWLLTVPVGTEVGVRYLGEIALSGGGKMKEFEGEVYGQQPAPPQTQQQAPPQNQQQQQTQQNPDAEFERLVEVLRKAKGDDAAKAISEAIKSLGLPDPVAKLKATLTAQSISF